MRTVLDSPKGKLVVSCQTLENEPLHNSFIMSHVALTAIQGGAVGIRANSVADISAIKEIVSFPMIRIVKRDYLDNEVFIITTPWEVDGLVTAEPETIALDAIARPCPGDQMLEGPVTQIRARYPSVLLMADIATVEETITAERPGFDCVDTTFYGYAVETVRHVLAENNCGFLYEVLTAVSVPIMAEENVDTPEYAACCLALGVHIVVVGGTITRPQQIATRFITAITS